jgi:hypothetical protein
MKRSNYLIWFRRLVVLGAVVAGLTASAAGAVPMLDPQDTPANPVLSHTTPQGLRADGLRWQAIANAYQQSGQTRVSHTTALGLRADGLRWQAIAKAYQESRQAPVPDAFERYAAAHPYGAGLQPLQRRGIGDFRPVTPAVGVTQAVGTERIVDDSFRDSAPIVTPAGERIVDDSFRDSPTVVSSPTSGDGLDWGDFGIGAGAMFGLALLVSGLGLGALAMRHRVGNIKAS